MSGIGWDTIWELFHFAILSALLAGIVCPLVGCFLLVRRTAFYGVALPQFAAAGVAFAWALPVWLAAWGWLHVDLERAAFESPHSVENYLLAMAAVFTFGGLLLLWLFGERKETETARVAAAFAIASAATILFAMASPHGGEVIDQLLRGEILTVDLHEFETIAVAYVLVLAAFLYYERDLLVTSFDPDTARVLGKPARAFEALLSLLTGVTVAVGTIVVGPIVLFGLLVLPPLAARRLARSMRSFLVTSSALGVLAAVGGALASFRLDWPLGPAVVAAAAALLAPVAVWEKLRYRSAASSPGVTSISSRTTSRVASGGTKPGRPSAP